MPKHDDDLEGFLRLITLYAAKAMERLEELNAKGSAEILLFPIQGGITSDEIADDLEDGDET